MSFNKVEVRVFSGPDQVQVGSNTEPDLIVINNGPKGDTGAAATIAVGTTTTLSPGSSATVVNAGTSSAAVFNFGIPTGATGATGASGGSSTAWRYRAKTNATSGYPTNGHLLWDNATQLSATNILISHLDDEGSDIEFFLSFFIEGQKIFIQNRDDSSQNQVWEITGTPTVTNPNTSTAYYTFPVTLVSSAGAPFTNNHSILFGSIAAAVNAVTSATTSDGTANLAVASLQVYPSGSIFLASTNSGGVVILSGQLATDERSIEFPNASGTLALTSQLPTLGTNVATFLETPTSANLAAAVTGETGSGALVFGTSPSLTSPTIGTAATFNATTYTYGAGAAAAHRTALGLTTLATTTPAANVATFLETPSSANLAAAVTDETGTGALVFATSPTITTPTISGTATVSGSFGVGTVSPQAKFDVNAGTALFLNSFNIYGSSTTGAGSVFGKISNTNTAGRTLLSFSETPFDAVTPSLIQRYGSTHSSKPNLLEVLSTGAIELMAGSATSIFCSASGMIGIGTTSPNAKAVLDLTSTTRGFLPPRMTTIQRDAITSVPAGLMVYNTTTNKLNFYNGSAWEAVTSL